MWHTDNVWLFSYYFAGIPDFDVLANEMVRLMVVGRLNVYTEQKRQALSP